jgi:hypothetical protein
LNTSHKLAQLEIDANLQMQALNFNMHVCYPHKADLALRLQPLAKLAGRAFVAAGTPDVARQNCAGNPGTKQMGPGVRESRNLARFNKCMCPGRREGEFA